MYPTRKSQADQVEVLIQVNGKPKARIQVGRSDKDQLIEIAKQSPSIMPLIDGKPSSRKSPSDASSTS